MTREEFIAAVDWGAVAAGMRETRAGLIVAVAQLVAQRRADGQRETRADKEMLAGWQGTADLLDAWLTVLAEG
jgi:hypothetical protein